MSGAANKFDKSKWGAGPWQTEPDRVDFRHAGLPCLLLRNQSGVWCGYAAALPGHPWHGKGYRDVDLDVHGGPTYADACGGNICHVPAPGEPDNVWWFGFDCNHGGDFAPAWDRRSLDRGGQYRTLAYARREVERLAEQLARAAIAQAEGGEGDKSNE